MGCCDSNELTFDKPTSRKRMAKLLNSMSEEEIRARVEELWAENKLESEQSMTLQMAQPFITEYIKEVKGIQKVEFGLIMQIFNEIDGDGNQALDQQEMFDFIKNQEFKDSNIPQATIKRQKSLV